MSGTRAVGARARGWVLIVALTGPLGAAAIAAEDPYLWLEDIDGERALSWVRQQNRRTAERLKAGPLFAELHQQALTILNSRSRIPEVQQRGRWLYNFWRDDAHPRGIYRRTTLTELRREEPEWEVVLDIDAMAAADGVKWVFHGMQCLPPDHRLCLVRLSPGGGDAEILRELDAEKKAFVAGGFELPEAKLQAGWLDRDTLFVATDFGPGSLTSSGYPRIVKLWRRGTPLDAATTIFEAPASSVSASGFRMRSDGGDIDLLIDRTSFWTASYRQLLDGELHRLELPETAVVEGNFDGRLLVSLKEDWRRGDEVLPQGAVLVADPAALRGAGGPLEVLVEPDGRTVVEGVAETPQGVLVSVLDSVRGRLFRLEPRDDGGWHRRDIPFPDNGALDVRSIDDENGTFFVRYEGFTEPPALYRVAGSSWKPERIKAQAATFDGRRFRVEQHFARSADGTEVPYFVVMGKGLRLDGKNPTHIFSYGGFRVSLTPSYSGTYESLFGAYGQLWLERGGVFVLANIRGGGELGPDWHAAALLDNRPKAYEDFEAVAEDLIRRQVTSARRIGIEGRSNGGLLVGAAFTRRPDLYGAVICGVPLLDMKRYHKLLAGASWMAEYGDPDDPEQWKFIESYSPYHNLQKGADYPAVFFYTSTRDDRVHPGHARKMAARMMELGHDVWYYENIEGGHGGSSTNDQLAYRVALAYTHLWTQLAPQESPQEAAAKRPAEADDR